MFREGNHSYYRGDLTKYNHNIVISRGKEFSWDVLEIKYEIARLKRIIKTLEKHENKTDLMIEKLNQSKEDLLFWQNEMNKFDNLPSHKKLKRTRKKIKPEKLKELVLKEIKDMKENEIYFLTKEDLSYKLQVKKSDLDKIFMELNREGILSQAHHHFMHDSNRGNVVFNECSDWAANTYSIH